MKLIGVIGGRKADDAALKAAEEVGRLIAMNNAILICGGLIGVMEAVSMGAKSANGITVGILPQGNKKYANKYIDITIPTGFGIARNIIIARAADALIAIDGEYGTLSEIAFGLQLGKPVIGLNTWDIEGVVKAENADDAVKKAISSSNSFNSFNND